MNFIRLPVVGLCVALASTMLLSACIAPALLMTSQSQLLWALLKPMVGLDPKEANLFKQPLIQSRLQPLLGSHFDSAVQLLETADKIQQEGPLFYVVSKYTPVPELAEKAGFVWNSETNQMAVLLVSGGAPQIFAEKLNAEIAQQVPIWPAELADYTDPVKLRQQALNKTKEQLKDSIPVPTSVAPLVDTVSDLKDVKGQTKALLEHKQQALVNEALSPLTEAKQQATQLKDQAVNSVTAPLTEIKQQAGQQIQQINEQAVNTVTAPLNNTKQQAGQHIQQINEQAVNTVTAPLNNTKQQAGQQIQQIKEQAANTVTAPLNNTKQQAAHQMQQIKEQAANTVTAPLNDTKQQAAQQMQQIKEQAADTVTAPLNTTKQQAAQQMQQIKEQAADRVTAPLTNDIQQTSHKAQLPEEQLNSKVEVPAAPLTPATGLDPEDDLAAELATEQQALKNEQSQQISKLQQEISLAEQQLKQASSAPEISKLQQQIRQLKATLQLLQASH